MASEIELKLALPRDAVARLLRHPALARLGGKTAATRRLLSVYFDTADLRLKRERVALRLRKVGRQWIQTVKAQGTVSAGLHRRPEWEAPVPGGQPDLAEIGDPALARLFQRPEVRHGLKPVFATEITRTTRILEPAGSTRVELAVDRGEIRAGGASRAISEIELELMAGDPRPVFELALELAQSLPLELEVLSKAERGYQLLAGEPAPAMKAHQPELERAVSVNAALKQIVSACARQFLANVDGMREGRDVEYLHQMRVALRRLRSALSTFSTVYRRELFAPVQDELRWLTSRLGPARDWDVFMTETLPPALAAFPEHAGLAALDKVCRGLRHSANAAALEAIASARYRQLMLGLSAWINCEPWLAALDPDALAQVHGPLKPFADTILEKRHRGLLKRGRRCDELGAEELHQLRIAGKKLRYAAEFFAGLYSRKAARCYLAHLQALQDVLGAINDGATTGALLEQAACASADTQAQAAAGIITGWSAQVAATQRQQLGRVWKRFKEAKPFWGGRS